MLDRILVDVPPGRSIEDWETILRSALPAGVTVARQGRRPTKIAACWRRSVGTCAS